MRRGIGRVQFNVLCQHTQNSFREDIMTVTETLYLPGNEYQKTFDAKVQESGDGYVVLDRTLFYKEGGGQPADRGTLTWEDGQTSVTDVQKEHGEIRHYVKGSPPGDAEVRGEIDWERRYSHMRMHTAQHVLSKVALDLYGAETEGNQIHADRSRIDFDMQLTDQKIAELEQRTNEIIEKDLAVEKSQMERERAEDETPEGRGLFDLIPDSVDPLRMVRIEGFDLCPCGGTHVDSTGELEGLKIVHRESKGSGVDRVKFELN